MHFEDYHKHCSDCDRPIKWQVLGRSIIITPCPCQIRALIEACKHALICLQDHPDWHTETKAEIEQTLANATK